MAVVYEADDTDLGCRVALKLSHATPADPAAIERFHREARFAKRTHHPYICPVYEDGEIGGRHYLTMPIIEGTPLDKRTGLAHPWPEKDVIDLVRRLAFALQAVHDAGVVHRDLKPHNVMIRPTGEPVLMDFGLARDLSGKEIQLTKPGTALGTLAFVPPEQALGQHAEIGPPTDVYSLGIILYLLLTGRLPFDAANPVVLCQRILSEPPARPGDFRPGLSPKLEAVVLWALAKSPAGRFASMTEFAAALAEARPASGSVVVPSPFAPADPEQCDVPGTWYARPAGNAGADWTKAAVSPGKVPAKPGTVYRFVADRSATDRHLDGLTARPDLDGLDLGKCDAATPEALTAVARLTSLRELTLTRGGVGGVPVTDAALARLARLKSLEELDASLPDVTDAGFAAVGEFAALTRAELHDCGRLTDAGVAHLTRLPALVRLHLGGCPIADLGLRRLAALPKLRDLTLEDCHRVTGPGLAFFTRPGGLLALTLSGGRGLGDESLAPVAGLPALELLELRNNSRLTGTGFAHLAAANRLRMLVLTGCRGLTDAGLGCLAGLTALERLELSDCDRVTPAGLDRVRRALPGCRVRA
jgi:hypothetical protein